MRVIVNADDFGMNTSCTLAIKEAFKKNLISSTTMIANMDAFDLAISIMEEDGLNGKIGVHFNLNDGEPLTEEMKNCQLFTKDGVFHGNIKRLKPLTKKEKRAIYLELTAQVVKLERAGVKLTHADSHHHIHTCIFIAPIILKICKEHNIDKIRLHRNIGSISSFKAFIKKRFNKMLKNKGFKTTAFFGGLNDLEVSPLKDLTEIMVHPDYDKKENLIDAIDIEDGYSVGEEIINLGEKEGVTLISYGEL